MSIINKININVLCILKINIETNLCEVDYIDINYPSNYFIESLITLCNDKDTSLEQIIEFIEQNEELHILKGSWNYCTDELRSAYHNRVEAGHLIAINSIKHLIERIKKKEKEEIKDPKFNINEEICKLKNKIVEDYILWNKVFFIHKCYGECDEDNSILAYSHRKSGWGYPWFSLTPNFKIQILSNFGYGNSSYFYVKLKFKNIDIIPLSEWIEYEYAQFSEIVRYTQRYSCYDESWLDALEFSRDACNLSIIDEEKFIDVYIITECEKMVNGLEIILENEKISFSNRLGYIYNKDMRERVLITFRGEKISGALDFMSKIQEYEKITSMSSFIKRIENYNKKIQPILENESQILINVDIPKIEEILNKLKPIYDEKVAQNKLYDQKREELKKEINDNIDKYKSKFGGNFISNTELDKEFNLKYPEYSKFKREYEIVTDEYNKFVQNLNNLMNFYRKIMSYIEKINNYFRLNN